MSLIHQLWIGSLLAAVAFFIAGLLTGRLRQRGAEGARCGEDSAALAQARAELTELRASEARAQEAAAAARAEAAQLAASRAAAPGRGAKEAQELEALRRKLAETEAALGAEQAKARHLERRAEPAGELTREAQELQGRLGDVERLLAERSSQLRDAISQVELLKSRASEADALRAEYVRLRTQANEMEFLTKEVERLSEALRSAKSLALGGRARPPRPSRPVDVQAGSITDALAGAITRFTDAHVRGVAIADNAGFPIASHGDDGIELAAYAAMMHDVAQRAKQFLPMSAPVSIELLDEQGARVTVWPFDVSGDRLLLASLAVAPAEPERVETTLAEVAGILAPGKFGAQSSA